MKILTCIIFSVFVLAAVKSQMPIPVTSPTDNFNDSLLSRKISYTLTTGASFISTTGTGKGTSFFISPALNYNFSPKLNLNTGLVITQNNYSLPVFAYRNENNNIVTHSEPIPDQNVFYAIGNYQLSKRFVISGALVSTFPGNESTQNYGRNNSFKSVSMGVSYKINNNISFGADVRVVQSNGLNSFEGANNSILNTGILPY